MITSSFKSIGFAGARTGVVRLGYDARVDEVVEGRWLDAEERSAWLNLIGLLMRLGPALDAQLRRDAGLTLFEYSVLAGLSEQPGRTMRMSDLAAVAGGSLSRLSQVVARLEHKGLVRRAADPTDGRYTLATLTDPGWEIVVATAPGHVAEVRRLVFDPLTRPQVKQLATIGRRIGLAIDPGGECLPG